MPMSTLAVRLGIPESIDWRRRGTAAGIHLLLSATVAAAAAILVFGLWYPGEFRWLAGGRELFLLVTSVDVVMGPVLTFAVFNRAKGIRHLRRDLAVIGLLQLAALGYGLHTVFIARPVAMVFEVDRFQLVTANDLVGEELPKAAPQYRQLPLTGPTVIAARRPETPEEHRDVLFTSMGGIDIAHRPSFWQPYDLAKARAVGRSRPLIDLLEHYPADAAASRTRLQEMGVEPASGRFLPAKARSPSVAVLDAEGNVRGYLPLEGFF